MTTMPSPSPLAAFSADLSALAERLRPSVVLIRSNAGGGSGVIWREDGLIITNSHVVPREQAEVVLADGRTMASAVAMRDPRWDLAALRVEAVGLPAAAIGDSTRLRPGQIIVAMGNPLGREGAATIGIVSTRETRMRGGRSGRGDWRGGLSDSTEFIRANVLLAPGNSGGPIVDTEARVLGINSRIAGPRLALSIPSHSVERFLSGATSGARRLGIGGREVELPVALREQLGLHETTAVMVVHLVEGELAERSGLLLGDMLLALNGRSVPTLEALLETLAAQPTEGELQLTILRAGQIIDLAIEQPASGGPAKVA